MTNANRLRHAAWLIGSAVGAGIFLLGAGAFLHLFASSSPDNLLTQLGQRCARLGAWFAGGTGAGHLTIGLIALSPFIAFLALLAFQARATHRYLRSLRFMDGFRSDNTTTVFTDKLRLASEALGLRADQVRLVDSTASLCFTAGFFRPKIYVSNGALRRLDRRELLAVMTHEKHHLTSGDPARSAALSALARAFFFLPVIRSLEMRHRTAKEIAADAEALKVPDGRLALAGALYKLTAPSSALSGDPAASGVSLFAQRSMFDLRVALLAGQSFKPAPLAWSKIISSVLVLAAFGFVIVPNTHAETAPNDCGNRLPDQSQTINKVFEQAAPRYSSVPSHATQTPESAPQTEIIKPYAQH